MSEGSPRRMPIGRVLVERRVVTSKAVEDAALAAPSSDSRLCSKLLDAGACDERDLASALAERHGVPGVDLSRSVLHLAPLSVVPHAVAEADALLPLSTVGGRLHLAVASPDASDRIIAEVRFVTGLEVSVYVAVLAALREAIAGAYAAHATGATVWRGAAAPLDAPPGLAVLPPGPPRAAPAAARSAPVAEAVEIDLSDEHLLDPIEAPPVLARAAPPERPQDPPAPPAAPPRAGRRRVLVVDDEPAIRLLAQRALEHRGFEVMGASDGAEALERARLERPDLVLLDAMLPRLHGFDVARRLRSEASTRAIPVVIMSAVYRGWRFAADARDLYGAQDYVEKPFRVDDLVHCVEAALARGEARGGSAAPALAVARAAAAEGRVDEAVAAAEQAVEADPFSAEAHRVLGELLRSRGEGFRAMTELERAVDLGPELLGALKSLAALYLETGFRAKAAEALERAVRAAPAGEARDALRADLLRLL